MKTIKIFAFAVLVSLAWVACKDNTAATTSETPATTEAAPLTDTVFMHTKDVALTEVAKMTELVTQKIAQLETAVAAAKGAEKNNLNSQLEAYKQYLVDLQGVNTKIADATAETWSGVSQELDSVHYEVKMAMTAEARGNMGATPPAKDKISN